MPEKITVEVVFAEAGRQSLLSVTVDRDATVADAIRRSRIASQHPQVNLDDLPVGIWGRIVARDRPLQDGDRVELYRNLRIDPREARRQLAEAGRTMRQGEDFSAG